ITHHSSLITHHSSLITHHSSLITHHSSLITHHSSLIIQLMNWGKSIVLVFIVFAGFIGTMVVLMSRERIDLVRDDYYQDEIAYQQQIDRVANSRRFDPEAYIQYRSDRRQVEITLPDSLQQGTFTLYRPADRQQDIQQELTAVTPSPVVMSMKQKPGGLWRAKLTWSDGQREYYTERELTLP
ncbi:FixH family protein, partial [Spirosoma utsteinense]|uniref:FixH family protein n=1 Tax=Spirosoma utsteinense TaxID=2585773 RepID=UPI001FD21FAB